MQQNRLAIANVDLQKAQAELDAKQAELDVVQAEYEKAMMEKQVNSFTYFLKTKNLSISLPHTKIGAACAQKTSETTTGSCDIKQMWGECFMVCWCFYFYFYFAQTADIFVTFPLLRLINEHQITYNWTSSY